MLNDGTYPAQVLEGMLGKASTGNEQVAVSLEITDGEGNPTGDQRAWYGSFTEAAYPYTVRALRTMGWQGDDLSDLSSIAGAQVSVVLRTEEYKGKSSQRVAFINPPGGGAILKDQMSADAARAFAAKMKAKVRAVGAEAGKPKTNGAPKPHAKPKSKGGAIPPEPPPLGDSDEIPF